MCIYKLYIYNNIYIIYIYYTYIYIYYIDIDMDECQNFVSSRTAPDLGGDRRRPLIGSPDGETTQSRHAVPAWNRRVVMGIWERPPMVPISQTVEKYGKTWETSMAPS